MNCENVRETILTDYADGQLGEEQKKRIDRHLAICGHCREYEQLTEKAVVEPFRDPERHNPPEEAWRKIKARIEKERLLRLRTPFAELLYRLKSFLYIPRPAFVIVTITVVLLVAIAVMKLPHDHQKVMKKDLENQIECITYLISVFDQESMNGNDDFKTPIEEYFL